MSLLLSRPHPRIHWSALTVAWLGLMMGQLLAALVESVRPLALVAGAVNVIEIRGTGLLPQARLSSFFWDDKSFDPVTLSFSPHPGDSPRGALQFSVTWDARFQAGIIPWCVTQPGGKPELWLGFVDDLKTIQLDSSQDGSELPLEITPPTAVEGVILEAKSQYIRFRARRGDEFWMEIVARRMGSPLDALVVVTGPTGKTLVKMDDSSEGGADPVSSFRASATGAHGIQITDARYMGGPNYWYRLRLQTGVGPRKTLDLSRSGVHWEERARAQWSDEAEPNDEITGGMVRKEEGWLRGRFGKAGDRDLAAFEIKADERWFVNVRTRSLGSFCDAGLRWLRADGVVVSEMDASRSDEGSFTNKFAHAGTYYLEARELSGRSGVEFRYELKAGRVKPGFALETEMDHVECAAGGQWELEIKARRYEFDGPIALRVNWGNTLLSGTNQVMASQASVFKLRLNPPAGLVPGEARWIRIEGVATLGQTESCVGVSTLPALRKRFPMMLYPPLGMDGAILARVLAH